MANRGYYLVTLNGKFDVDWKIFWPNKIEIWNSGQAYMINNSTNRITQYFYSENKDWRFMTLDGVTHIESVRICLIFSYLLHLIFNNRLTNLFFFFYFTYAKLILINY